MISSMALVDCIADVLRSQFIEQGMSVYTKFNPLAHNRPALHVHIGTVEHTTESAYICTVTANVQVDLVLEKITQGYADARLLAQWGTAMTSLFLGLELNIDGFPVRVEGVTCAPPGQDYVPVTLQLIYPDTLASTEEAFELMEELILRSEVT